MKSVTPPMRASPASRKNRPVTMTRPNASTSLRWPSPLAIDAVAAASTAADEEVAETIAKRLVPSTP
ncbi:hypothetical protein GALL_365540 [mine drainage metagenome]|uniref:Uncharacterized protein n=1 Tax=mine drainage metagenome TaxID=410659 RepID=A0A1J5QP02_9ZZZZ